MFHFISYAVVVFFFFFFFFPPLHTGGDRQGDDIH